MRCNSDYIENWYLNRYTIFTSMSGLSLIIYLTDLCCDNTGQFFKKISRYESRDFCI